MKSFIIHVVTVVMAVFTLISSHASAATPGEVTALTGFLVQKSGDPKEVLWKGKSDSYQVVLDLEDRRVTIEYFKNNETREGWIALWWRMKQKPQELWACTLRLNGRAIAGVDPKRQRVYTLELPGFSPVVTFQPIGVSNQDFWQKEGDRLVRGLLNFYTKNR